jgi:hypothetical protein
MPLCDPAIEERPLGGGGRSQHEPDRPRWYSTNSAYLLTIVAVLALSAATAAATGFLTVDSWNYLHLAQSIRHGEGCTIAGSYFATFPCGYPLAIALTSPSSDIASLMISSKATNLLLLSIAFLLLKRTFHNILVSTFVIINPFTIELSLYTWSENLFLVACCGSLFALSRMRRAEVHYPYRAVATLMLFLLVGVTSRYFFAPFAVTVFVAAWLAYGWRTALRALPAFVVAALFFAGYMALNLALTGLSTGMPRIEAQETFGFLLFRFLRQLAKEGVFQGVSVLVLLGLATRYWSRQSADAPKEPDEYPELRMLIFAGVGFLLLGFYLRLRTQYDIYSPRTLSYGLTFVVAGLLGWLTRVPARRFPAVPVLLYGILATLTAQSESLPPMLKSVLANRYVSPARALQGYHSAQTNADLIVTLDPPNVGATMDGYAGLYYPKHAAVVNVHSGPYDKRDRMADFRKSIAARGAQACVIDFTPFATREDFERYIDQTFPVALSFSSVKRAPRTVYEPAFDPGIRDELLAIFQPARYVPCDAWLKATSAKTAG